MPDPAAAAICLAPCAGADMRAYSRAVEQGGCRPLGIAPGQPLPADAAALIMLGDPALPPGDAADAAARLALQRGIPVLGAGSGMAALNAAAGGAPAPEQKPEPHDGERLFITLGSKLAHIVGGSGWVRIPVPCAAPVTQARLAPPLMASCYDDAARVYGLEHPGRAWIIGVHWDPLSGAGLPRGVDTIVDAFVQHARKSAGQGGGLGKRGN